MIRLRITKKTPLKVRKRLRNKARLRKKLMGTKERPRLVVFRSQKHIYAQIVDDISRAVMASANTVSKKQKIEGKKCEQAKVIGQKIAEIALKNHIKKVVFDRNGFIYHGRVKALAQGARAGGLVF